MTGHRLTRATLPLLLAVTLFLSLAVALQVQAQRAAAGAASSAYDARRDGLSFVVTAPAALPGADGRFAPDVLNSVVRAEGAPALPVYQTMVAVPPGAEVSIVVRAVGESAESSPPIPPVATPRLDDRAVDGINADPDHIIWSEVPDAAVYGQDALYPATLYQASAPQIAGGLRLVHLTLFPLRYNPQQQMLWRADLHVDVTFVGGEVDSAESAPIALDGTLAGSVINLDQARNWPAVTPEPGTVTTNLPVGVPTYKITVNQPGIYRVTYADLQAAGMDVGSVNPYTLQMMHRGETVRFAWAGDLDTIFEPGESVRFYGYPFEGSRDEAQHVTDNVFWLWAGTAGTYITRVTNTTGTAVSEVDATVTADPDYVYHPTWTNQWDTFDNEATPYFWRAMWQYGVVSASYDVTLTVPFPATTGPDATYQAEVFGLWELPHDVTMRFNADPASETQKLWSGRENVNIDGTVPQGTLVNGVNTVTFDIANDVAGSVGWDYTFLERVTVTYRRQLKTDDNRLAFGYAPAGTHRFSVSGFTESNAANVLAWDITDPLNPVAVTLTAGDVSGTGPYTYGIGRTNSADSRFFVSTVGALRVPTGISEYVGASLEPAGGGAEWLAISYGDFIGEVDRLADHRAATSGLTTHIVDVEDVVNQYGYGLRTPNGVRDYIAHAVADWTETPRYVVLAGDTTLNPRRLPCLVDLGCTASSWSLTDTVYVPTFFQAIDRFQGFVPSDHGFTTVVGTDDLADLAVGRLSASTVAHVTAMVDKIILYETQQAATADWMKNILFVSDDFDPAAGDFCLENAQLAADHLPALYNDVALCLASTGAGDVAALRAALFDQVNVDGTIMVNYRGHGGTRDWGDSLIMRTPDDVPLWTNADRPVVILSADCLDGAFAGSGYQGLAEAFMRHSGGGSAAHWSSTGLGFTWEHTVLHEGFFDGVFSNGLTAVGDAINYSKLNYATAGYDESEMYAFTLQGDPAMNLVRPDLAVTMSRVGSGLVTPGATVEYVITVSNNGRYPTTVRVTDLLPAGMTYFSHTSSAPVTFTNNGSELLFDFSDVFDYQDTATINLKAKVANPYTGGTALINTATATGSALDADSADNTATFTVSTNDDLIYVAMNGSGTVGGVTYAAQDILAYDGATGQWSMHFDGSDVGLSTATIDAFLFYQGDKIVMSFASNTSVPGAGTVTGSDLVLFTPTALGNNTSGTFVLAFDGSDVELEDSGENIDAITIIGGLLGVSVTGDFDALGIIGADEDVLLFENAVFGPNTSGTWSLYFDGSDLGLTGNDRDIVGLWYGSGSKLYLSTLGSFTVGPISIAATDIAVCALSTTGETTACNLAQSGIYWRGAPSGVTGPMIADFVIKVITAPDAQVLYGMEKLK